MRRLVVGTLLVLCGAGARAADEIIGQLFREIADWAGDRGQYDDLTAVVLRSL